MAVAGILKVLIDADTKKFNSGMASIGKRINALGPEVARFGAILSAAIGAGLVASVVKAASFEKQMSKVGSLLGDMEKKVLPQFTKGIQVLSTETGQSVNSLSTALFDLVSAGMDTDKAMKILAESAKLAVGGFTTTDAATQALITTMQTFKGEIKDAADASDFLFAVQKGGRLTVEQVASSIGSFAAVGKAAGVSATDLGAAFASISLAGEGAETASTQLRAILIALQKDSEGMTKTAREMGLEIDFAKIQTEGLMPWLQQFSNLTGPQIAKLFQESRALRGMNTMLANLDEVQKRVNITTDRAGESSRAYARRAEELTLVWNKMLAMLAQIARNVGGELMPEVKELVNFVLAHKTDLLNFMKQVAEHLRSWLRDFRVVADFMVSRWSKAFSKQPVHELQRELESAQKELKMLTETVTNPLNAAMQNWGDASDKNAARIKTLVGRIRELRDEIGKLPISGGGGGVAGGVGGTGGGAGAGGDAGPGGGDDAGGQISPLSKLGLFGMENDISGAGSEMDAILEGMELQTSESAVRFSEIWDEAFSMVFESSSNLFDGLTSLMQGMTDTLSATFNEIFVGLADGTANLGEIMQNMITGMRDMFFKVAADMLARWVMTLMMKKVASMAQFIWEKGMQTTAAVTDVSIYKTAALAKIKASTGVAQAASLAAYAGIPFVGIGMGMAQASTITGLMAGFAGFAALAEGGIVTKPTIALMGEAGPEAVVPLDKAGGIGSGEIHIHINGEFIEGDETSWDDLVRSRIVPALQAYNAKGLGGIA